MSIIDRSRLFLGGILFIVSLTALSAPPGWSPVMLNPLQKNMLQKVTMPTAIDDSKLVSKTFNGYKQSTDIIDFYIKNKKQIVGELANHEVAVRAFSIEADGKISFLTSLLVSKNKKIIVQQDYINYKNVITEEGKIKRVGVVFRIEAILETKENNVNLNGIFAIGLAVRQGSANGQLRIEVHGLSGEPINNLIPMPSEISESSLQNAMQAIATLKSKMFDQNVNVIPQDIPESL